MTTNDLTRSVEEVKGQPLMQVRPPTQTASQDTMNLLPPPPKRISSGAVSPQHQKEYAFLKEMLKFVRLPLINMKQLVTSIKFSGFFED